MPSAFWEHCPDGRRARVGLCPPLQSLERGLANAYFGEVCALYLLMSHG